jgi:peptidoglycan hydrolase-like protein with peptidoglycan-binding domain
MPYSLLWLPEILVAAGLKVAPVDGWQNRGRAEMGTVLGVMCHHTAGPKAGNMPSLRTLIEGRTDLAGPLAQLGLGRDGTYYVIAAGRCNHAGSGVWQGITSGNSHFVGIEAENTGRADDQPWPEIQMNAYLAGVAAILRHIGRHADACVGHKEYALPAGRKDDPTIDMVQFRSSLSNLLIQGITSLPLIPAVEPGKEDGSVSRPTLRRGSSGELVSRIQAAVGSATVNGEFDSNTEALVRTFQRLNALVPDGIVGPKTWAAIDSNQ